MIQVQISSSVSRNTVTVNEKNTTPKEVLNDQKVNLSQAIINLDGTPLSVDQLNKTFEQLGCPADQLVYLSAVTKTTNA